MKYLLLSEFKSNTKRVEYGCVYGSNTIQWNWDDINIYIEKRGNKINWNKQKPYSVLIHNEAFPFKTLAEAMKKAYDAYLREVYVSKNMLV